MISDSVARDIYRALRESVNRDCREESEMSKLEAAYNDCLIRLGECIQRHEERQNKIREEFTRRMQEEIGKYSERAEEMTGYSRTARELLRRQWEEITPKMEALAKVKEIMRASFGMDRRN